MEKILTPRTLGKGDWVQPMETRKHSDGERTNQKKKQYGVNFSTKKKQFLARKKNNSAEGM